MDSKRYEVQPNHDSTSRFLYKLVEIREYDSGHKSTSDVDFFVSIHDATAEAEKKNLENL